MKVEYEAFLVKVVCPKGKINKAKHLLRGFNRAMPKDFEIDEEYEGIAMGSDFYGDRVFIFDDSIKNQVKTK